MPSSPPPAIKSAVVELFTSQGCSSCPPADALLGQLTEKPGVVALSYSVDYWDYLGWRDTLGSPANSERQRAYARARGDGKVYTPQARGRRHHPCERRQRGGDRDGDAECGRSGCKT